MSTYTAASGHVMNVVTDHENRNGETVPDYWTAQHSPVCPCITSEDW